MQILFITLKTFSATGGIEKFNRCMGKALEAGAKKGNWRYNMLSAYDDDSLEDYVPKKRFKGFGKHWLAFVIQAWRSIHIADTIILGHINLGPLVLVAQWCYPQKNWINMAHGYELWTTLPKLKKRSLQLCTEIWAVSEFTRNKVIAQQNYPANKVRVFYNAIDPFFVQSGIQPSVKELRKRYNIEAGDAIILTLCRQSVSEERKGYEKIIRLMPQILQHHPNAKFFLAGKADAAENLKLQQLVAALNLENAVIRPGFIADEELAAHYALANLYVMPSSKEGFGIVLIEAAWMGLPVIAGNADGSAEALLHGALGKLVNLKTEDELLEAILNTLTEGYRPDLLSKNRELINQHYSFLKMKERLLVQLKH